MKSLSRVRLFESPWPVGHQVPASMGFPRQEYWSGLPSLVYFCFYFHYFRRWVIEDLAVIYVSVLHMFSSKSFIVSGLLVFISIVTQQLVVIIVFSLEEVSSPPCGLTR